MTKTKISTLIPPKVDRPSVSSEGGTPRRRTRERNYAGSDRGGTQKRRYPCLESDTISGELENKLEALMGSLGGQNEEETVRSRMSELALNKVTVV